MPEIVELSPGQSVVISSRDDGKPTWGLWVITRSDATYLIIGSFSNIQDARLLPNRGDPHSQWLTFREVHHLLERYQANWPIDARPHEAAFRVTGVDFMDGRVRIELGLGHHRQ